MDKNVHYKIINPDQKRRPAINKVWSQKCNILPEGMPHKLINQKREEQQQKINDAKQEIDSAISRVDGILARLRAEL